MRGDFSKAFETAYDYSEDISLITYNPNSIQGGIDPPINWLIKKFSGEDVSDTNYSLLFNNCGHVARDLFKLGVDSNGERFGTTMMIIDIFSRGIINIQTPTTMFNQMARYSDSALPTMDDLKFPVDGDC